MPKTLYAPLVFTVAASAAPATPTPDAPHGWSIDESVAALTGAKRVAAVLDSTEPLNNMLGIPQRASLVLRCQDGVLVAYVSWPQVLEIQGTSFGGGTYQTMVLWKRDQGAIDANFWDRSTDGTAAGKFTTGGAQKLIAKLYTAKTLVVRMTGNSTQDAVFDLGDVQTIATRVGAACGVSWSLKN